MKVSGDGNNFKGSATWSASSIVAHHKVTGVKVVDGTDGYTPVTTPAIGQKLTANIQTSNGEIGSYPRNEDAKYKWYYKDSTDTILDTDPTYTVTSDNANRVICVEVSVTDYEGSATWTATAAVAKPDKPVEPEGPTNPPYYPEGGGSGSGSGSGSGNTTTDENGWQQNADGTWSLINEDGSKATGWQMVKGTWYYMTNDGVMTTGWQKVDGAWYYLKDWGGMATGWKQVKGVWYYLNASGAMATGWKQVNGVWYFLNGDGSMVSNGWRTVNGKSYYFYASGAMAANTTTPDGYKVGADGAWVK